MLALVFVSGRVLAEHNLLDNGDLIEGVGGTPIGWRGVSQRYLDSTEAAKIFEWHHVEGNAAELCLSSRKRGVMRWSQDLSLSESLYSLSGEMRTQGLAPGFDLATIGIQLINPHGRRRGDRNNMFGVNWFDIDSSSDWKKGELLFRVGATQRKVEIVCKLEGQGTVCFRRIRLVQVPVPPSESVDVIELDRYPEEHEWDHPRPYGAPNGRYWVLVSTTLLLVAIAVFGWRALGPHRNEN